MKRCLWAWFAMLVGLALLAGFGILVALVSGFITARTNVWVGNGVMLVIISLCG